MIESELFLSLVKQAQELGPIKDRDRKDVSAPALAHVHHEVPLRHV